ncbi:hypothetical protein MPSEU_000605500 [Mayamaea pseudoterrestris]|nr:hypothetical protein MPSEU_000605500 [Mayamaea pseudoterrestris]
MLLTSSSTKNMLMVLLVSLSAPFLSAFAPASPLVSSSATTSFLTPPAFRAPPLFLGLSPLEQESALSESKRQLHNPTPVLVSALQNLARAIGEDTPSSPLTIAFAATAFALTLVFSPLTADAAMSGGRMGGSFGSSSRQSYSRPAPSRSSYGGGGYGGGSYSRPSVTLAPVIGGAGYYSPYSAFGNPFYAPRPMVYGGGGAIAINRGPSILDLMLVGGIAYVAWSAFANKGTDDAWTESVSSMLGTGTSVVQLSVALEVSNRDDPNSILSVLERLASTSKTDSRVGIQNLTSQVALELLRRKSSIVSGYSLSKHFRDVNAAQREYNSMSVKERSKFEQESTSKFGGVDYSSGGGRRGNGVSGQATVAVITLNLAIDGDSTKVPKINSIQDIEEALRKIAADVKVDDCLQSAEILWTPEDRTETLTLKDVVADYPELRSV